METKAKLQDLRSSGFESLIDSPPLDPAADWLSHCLPIKSLPPSTQNSDLENCFL